MYIAYDAEDGRFIWNTYIGESSWNSGPVVYNGRVYIRLK